MKLRFIVLCVLLAFFTAACASPTDFASTTTAPYDGVNRIQEDKADLFNRSDMTNAQQADYIFEKIICAIEADDTLALRELFSTSTVNNIDSFDEDIKTLVDFFEGKMVSYKRYGPGSNESKEGTFRTKDVFASFDVTTDSAQYRIAIRFCAVDSQNAENIGVYSLYIIKAENSDTEVAYWGNDVWNPGINIE